MADEAVPWGKTPEQWLQFKGGVSYVFQKRYDAKYRVWTACGLIGLMLSFHRLSFGNHKGIKRKKNGNFNKQFWYSLVCRTKNICKLAQIKQSNRFPLFNPQKHLNILALLSSFDNVSEV